MFLKLKQESSGYPFRVEEYRRAKGIALDEASISKIEVQRTLAKLKLKSMWANGQNKTKVTILTSEKGIYDLLTCPGTEVKNSCFRKMT